jgi:hypothetical protein
MTPLFDIFQAETGGSAHWLESAATLEDTKARDQQFAGARSPGEYALLSLEAENKFVTKLEGWAAHQSTDRKSAEKEANNER